MKTLRNITLALLLTLTSCAAALAQDAEWLDVPAWPNDDGTVRIQAVLTLNYVPAGPVTACVVLDDELEGNGPCTTATASVQRTTKGTSAALHRVSARTIEPLYMLLADSTDRGPMNFAIEVPLPRKQGTSVLLGEVELSFDGMTEGHVTYAWVRR